MTVYVDDALIQARVGRLMSRWCHLTADTEAELHKFAQEIGLKRDWYQYQPEFWHYDVTEGKAKQAQRAGAVLVSYLDMASWMGKGRPKGVLVPLAERHRVRGH